MPQHHNLKRESRSELVSACRWASGIMRATRTATIPTDTILMDTTGPIIGRRTIGSAIVIIISGLIIGIADTAFTTATAVTGVSQPRAPSELAGEDLQPASEFLDWPQILGP